MDSIMASKIERFRNCIAVWGALKRNPHVTATKVDLERITRGECDVK